jgi:hypothetical protein
MIQLSWLKGKNYRILFNCLLLFNLKEILLFCWLRASRFTHEAQRVKQWLALLLLYLYLNNLIFVRFLATGIDPLFYKLNQKIPCFYSLIEIFRIYYLWLKLEIMKIIYRLVVFVFSILLCGVTYSQDKVVTLTSSDFIKGLNNKDYLRKKLIENGFSIIGKNGTSTTQSEFYECWQYKSLLYVDIIHGADKENTIKVGVHENFSGFPERLIKSFPYKKNENGDKQTVPVSVTPTNKEISYILDYSRDSDNVRVVIWFDHPFYFFEYKIQK